jgi:hypothetical protein
MMVMVMIIVMGNHSGRPHDGRANDGRAQQVAGHSG